MCNLELSPMEILLLLPNDSQSGSNMLQNPAVKVDQSHLRAAPMLETTCAL